MSRKIIEQQNMLPLGPHHIPMIKSTIFVMIMRQSIIPFQMVLRRINLRIPPSPTNTATTEKTIHHREILLLDLYHIPLTASTKLLVVHLLLFSFPFSKQGANISDPTMRIFGIGNFPLRGGNLKAFGWYDSFSSLG